MIEVGELAPEFCLPNQDEVEICLRDLKGKWIILYFYPKDNTPGCTTEACEFSAQKSEFDGANAVIIGISPDSPKSHQGFISKQNLNIMLLSDKDKEMMKNYEAYGMKKLYGKETLGVIRSTLIIDPQGKIAHRWKSVKALGHAEKVKEVLQKLQLKS